MSVKKAAICTGGSSRRAGSVVRSAAAIPHPSRRGRTRLFLAHGTSLSTMPLPKSHNKRAVEPGPAQDGACGLCGKQVDKEDEWIEGTCTECGTRPFCFECVANFMEREVRGMDTKGLRKNDKNLVYARLYPQNIFARNTHIMSRKPICPGKLGAKDCPGLMDTAELHRPKKEAEAPPSLPAPAKKPKAPGQKLHKSSAKVAAGHKPTPNITSRSSNAGPAAGTAGARWAAPGASKPGGGAAARLLGPGGGGGGLEGDAEAAAPTFAQLQLAEEKARKKAACEARERERAAAQLAGAGAAVERASSSASSSSHLRLPNTPAPVQQQRSVSSANIFDLLAGEELEDEEDDEGLVWGSEPGEAGPGGGGGTAGAPADFTAPPDWPAGALSPEYTAQDEAAALEAAIAASLADAGGAAAAGQGAYGRPAADVAIAAGAQDSQVWAVSQPEASSATYWASEPAPAPAPAGHSPAPPDEDGEFNEGFAAGLAAALRAQQEQLQRQWQQAAATDEQDQVWSEPAPAPAPPPVWHEPVKAASPAAEQDEATVEDLLALMGIA
ncbi:hypothetical protein ABPG75_008258 [Micractinium tetrahymenae]